MKRTINELAEISAEKLNEGNVEILGRTLWFELQKQKKFSDLNLLIDKIRKLQAERDNKTEVEITGFRELTSEEKLELSKKIEANLELRITTRFLIDKNLMGGIKIKVGDNITDHSWRGKIEKIKERTGR